MALKKKSHKKRTIKKKTIKRRPLKRKKPAIKRKVVRKAAKRKPAKKTVTKKAEGNIVGSVTHYFPRVRAAVVKLKQPLSVGDTIKIKGHTTDFTQNVASMQIDHVPISTAKRGQEIGLLVDSRVRQHDTVYKI